MAVVDLEMLGDTSVSKGPARTVLVQLLGVHEALWMLSTVIREIQM